MYQKTIIKPVLTEKMAILEERENKYAFLVCPDANKTEIKKGRVFVLVTYDVSEARMQAKEATRNAAKKQEALYNEFKASQGFDALDKEIEGMKTSSSVASPE